MDIKKLQALVIDALEDIKAHDIKLFDTSHLTAMFDRIAVASGTSNRQTKALAASVRDKVKESGGTVVSIEGADTGEWVLVDLGDMVVHIMQPAIRDYYRLEEIWGEKEVKFGAARRTTKRVSEDGAEDDAPKKRGRHLTVSVSAEDEPKKPAKRATRTSAAAGKADADVKPARKAAAPKTPAGSRVKVAAPKSAAPKKAATPRKAAAAAPQKTAAPKKTATRRAPAKTRAAD